MKILKTSLSVILILIVLYGVAAYNYDNDIEDLGNDFHYDNGYIWGASSSSPGIPSFVCNYEFDERYIIAKQQLYGLLPEAMFNYSYPSLVGDYYWIIDKKLDIYYGPLSFQDFNKECGDLGIYLHLDTTKEITPRTKGQIHNTK